VQKFHQHKKTLLKLSKEASGADAIKKFNPSLGITDLGV